MPKDKREVGFVGLGLMGLPMSRRLCSGNYIVTVWNRTKTKTSQALAAGANLADSPSELAKRNSIVFLCLTDAEAVEDVLFRKDGIASGGPGKIIVDHSTIGPTAAKEFATRLHEKHDIRYVDAPVTGGVIGATEGTLTIFAGGHASDIETVRPALSLMSGRVLHMGGHGAGQTTKLCNQVMVMNTFVAMAEMLKLAENGGVDPTQIPDILADGFAASRVLELFGERMAHRDRKVTGRLTVAQKDLNLILAVGKQTSTKLPMCDTSSQLVRLAVSNGFGNQDITSLIQVYDKV